MFTAVVLLDHHDRLVVYGELYTQCVRDAIVHECRFLLSVIVHGTAGAMYKGMSSK